MAFWNKKSNYKQRDNYWFEEEEYNPNAYQGQGWGSYAGYTPYVYKPRYDMSMSLETRVRQLIKTITGKDLKVAQAQGWGNDNEYFYYNPEDLRNASDDEVLGRILQQLGKELYLDHGQIANQHAIEPKYKQLLDSLEANRADRQLAMRYPGTQYYARELWETRKVSDNPINKYFDNDGFNKWVKSNGFDKPGGKSGYVPFIGNEKAFKGKYYSEVQGQNGVIKEQNLPWEFCFNIHALQNGEEAFDFSADKVANNFSLALPFIDQYLSAPSFNEALAIYPQIKQYYPLPTEEEQKQMEQAMGQTQGLSQQEMRQLAKALLAEAKAKGERGEVDEDSEGFMRDFADDYRQGKWNDKRDMMIYHRYLALHQASANVLHQLISSILKDNSTKRFSRPFKRGKLDGKRMYKFIATGNLRIFKKPRVISHKDYLMSIVVDMSGSMNGSNSRYATQGAIVLCDVLERLNFPYEVLAYNGGVYTVKAFGQKLDKAKLVNLENAQGDNNESATIDVLTKHIANFDASNRYKKSVFWITDGQSNDPSTVKAKTTKLEKNYNTTVFAIGIGNSIDEKFLKASYNTVMKVDSIQELPKELTNLMRAQFRRG